MIIVVSSLRLSITKKGKLRNPSNPPFHSNGKTQKRTQNEQKQKSNKTKLKKKIEKQLNSPLVSILLVL